MHLYPVKNAKRRGTSVLSQMDSLGFQRRENRRHARQIWDMAVDSVEISLWPGAAR